MKVTTERFLTEAKLIHQDKYIYPDELAATGTYIEVTVICPIHGAFSTSFKKHIGLKHGCQECGKDETRNRGKRRANTVEQFIVNARAVHGDLYDYSQVVYTNTKTKVSITCRTHGTFEQSPNMHISNKQGCPECYEDRRHLGNRGFSIPGTIETALLYLVRFSSKDDSFIKVGITIRDIKNRWGLVNYGKYTISTIKTIQAPHRDVYKLEQEILQMMDTHKNYNKEALRNGNTECFIDSPEVVDQILQIMEQYKKE